jgi:ABC-type dipeptide/oligopeptide/nickel transport system permease component
MGSYLARRLGVALIAVWGVVSIVFVALHLSGDPVLLMVEPGTPLSEIARIQHNLGFDRPLILQYLSFLGNAVTGSFPDSLQYQRPALDVVLERLPATLLLAVSALILAIPLGGLVGYFSALGRNSAVRRIPMSFVVILQAVPNFYLAMVLVLVFAVQLRAVPTGGYGRLDNLILPAVALAAHATPPIARVFRASLIQVAGEDYIRTAHAKGVRRWRVMYRHVVSNALLPVVTVIGLEAGSLLGGAVIVESIFSWPGVGQLAISALLNRDYPVILADVTFLALVFVTLNFVVDVLYAYLDPRVRLAGER